MVTRGRTLVAVTVGPSNRPRVLPEEAPGVGLPVRVPAVAVVAQPSAWVLQDVVWKLGPLQTGGARVRLGHGAVVVTQFCESLRAGERRCTGQRERGRERGGGKWSKWMRGFSGRWENGMFWEREGRMDKEGGFGDERTKRGAEVWEEEMESERRKEWKCSDSNRVIPMSLFYLNKKAYMADSHITAQYGPCLMEL